MAHQSSPRYVSNEAFAWHFNFACEKLMQAKYKQKAVWKQEPAWAHTSWLNSLPWMTALCASSPLPPSQGHAYYSYFREKKQPAKNIGRDPLLSRTANE